MSDLDSAPTKSYSNLLEMLTDTPGDEVETLVLPTPTQEANQSLPETERQPSAADVGEAKAPSALNAGEKPPQESQQQPVQGDDVQLPPAIMQAAMNNYAAHHNMLPEDVTAAMVYANGMAVHWSTKHLDMSARGPTAQAMNRAFKYRPDVKESYNILLDSLKVDFRRAWSAARNFDFARVSRSTIHAHRKRRDELGCFKTRLQIQVILGGADHPDAVRQVQSYIDMCTRPDLKAPLATNFALKEQSQCWVVPYLQPF